MPLSNGVYDPETLKIAKIAFNNACAALPPERDSQHMRGLLAQCVLTVAGRGERDPERLSTVALRMIDQAAA